MEKCHKDLKVLLYLWILIIIESFTGIKVLNMLKVYVCQHKKPKENIVVFLKEIMEKKTKLCSSYCAKTPVWRRLVEQTV